MTKKLLSGRRILVVEDEMLVLMSIEDMLADLGCKSVTAAATVDQAIAFIHAQVFDAAMLDMNLNGTKSFPIADKLADATEALADQREARARIRTRST